MNWLFLGIAAASGILMAIQGAINGMVGKITGVLEGNFLVHVIGLALVAILLFVFGLGQGNIAKIPQIPWYGYLGGVINVGIIYGVMFSIPKIGATNATTAIIVGQVAMAMMVDWMGMFGLEKVPMHWTKVVGLVLLAAGGKMMLGK